MEQALGSGHRCAAGYPDVKRLGSCSTTSLWELFIVNQLKSAVQNKVQQHSALLVQLLWLQGTVALTPALVGERKACAKKPWAMKALRQL